MADALCGPSTALQSLQKQASTDRTLQQDRILARQTPSEVCHDALSLAQAFLTRCAQSFRSAPGPNAGMLDAEFEAFQAGHPLQDAYPGSDLFHRGPPATSFQQNISQTQLPSWVSDFQNMHLNDAQATPIPQSEFHQHAPLQRKGEWYQEYLRQQYHPSSYQNQQQQASAGPNYSKWSYGYTDGPYRQHRDPLSPMALQNQPEKQADAFYDEAAFEMAFDAAREEIQQSEESARKQETQVDTGLLDSRAQEGQNGLDHIRIGADRIIDEAIKRREEGKEADDAEELARTAGQLLEKVKSDQSPKFRESLFLSLMRQVRDKDVRVEGNGLVHVNVPSSAPQTQEIQVCGLTSPWAR